MALVLYTNNYSIISQRYLQIANSGLAKNIERLSSGLRINHAADDASGLAISEKMRAQIRGLKRAMLNTQDGISYLQTAEGGMNSIADILQRMRELAVQAGNGTYTTNDRIQLQKEVDQLKAEIDRQAASTEFNTKKLLNGNSTALWSADSPYINAIIRSEVAEGNYRLDFSVDPGKNYIYKSDIMTLNPDAIGAGIVSANNTNVTLIVDPKGINPTGTAYFTATVQNSAAASAAVIASASLAAVYSHPGSSWICTDVTAVAADASGYVEIEFLNTVSATDSLQFRARFINAATGEIGAWTLPLTGNATGFALNYTSAAGNINLTSDLTIGLGSVIQQGDKALISVSRDIAVNGVASGGGTIRLTDGPANANGPLVVFSGINSLTLQDNGDAVQDTKSATVYYVDMDVKTGNLNIGSMAFVFKETSDGVTVAGDFQLHVNGAGDVATTGTRLKDIARFVNADGRNILDNTQELTIFGNGRQTVVYIEGCDTISDLERKLTKAIVEDLGMGADGGIVSAGGSFNFINSNLVNYVGPKGATPYTNEAVVGTFVIQTALLGDDSRLTFTGDQGLIDALSLATIQHGENSAIQVKVSDAHTGVFIGSEVVWDGMLKGVIKGVAVDISSKIGIYERWDEVNRRLVYRSTGKDNTAYLHIVDNRTDLQVGANKGQTVNISVTQLDCLALGITNLTVVHMDLAQKGITLLDRALERVNSARSSIGAQINRLEHTINGIMTGYENMIASESRIRDLDYAEETALFIRNQILVNAAVSMLAQANRLPELALPLIRGS